MANKEVKVAIVVGLIMITACIIFYIISNSNNKVEEINIEIYKSYQLDEGREYIRCNVSTDELVSINREYKKITKLQEEDKLVGRQINGTYMIRNGEEYIAFDADGNNLVYVNANGIQAIFNHSSSIYELVSSTCSLE